jgi:hypothetical protein
MSNPNTFNKDLMKTGVADAYKFTSFSPYIINGGLNVKFSPVCIFCSSNNTMSLTHDGGSFRQCNTCKKQFKAKLTNDNFIPPYKTTK